MVRIEVLEDGEQVSHNLKHVNKEVLILPLNRLFFIVTMVMFLKSKDQKE